jgi:2-keto-4-pentenoate hydratase/2-oxohepta-3-ene-1,7-dioic acid hydratase in catechol pathway
MQTGNTNKMIFNFNFILSYLSNFMSLQPGDVVTTGTPPGVGMGMKPPVFLKRGDKITLEVTGLGMQNQTVV